VDKHEGDITLDAHDFQS